MPLQPPLLAHQAGVKGLPQGRVPVLIAATMSFRFLDNRKLFRGQASR
jgi:hypothetical protein